MENLQCLPIGTIISGTTYRVDDVLGQGNFGITYKVYDTVLGDTYALKEFFPQDLADRNSSVSIRLETPSRKMEQFDELKKKFISEAKSLKACQHPGIVNIQMVIPSVDTVYYLMDFIDGVTLNKKYSGKPLDATDAIAIIKKIAAPLKHVHDRNIVHFDLNPNNVMVRADGSIVLIDFGFAKRYDQSGQQMSSLLVAGGTIGYIALEQIGGIIKEFTPSTDLYALGGILYFLLTGHAPVSCLVLLQDDSVLLKDLPDEFHDFFKKAMALKVNDRFASVDEFVESLDSIIDNTPVAESKYKPIQREDGKWNYINDQGKYLSDQWFDNADDFSEGWAIVKLDDKWNLIDASGKYIVSIWCDWVDRFIDGWAPIKLNDQWNFANSKGEYLSNVWFEDADSFSLGWARVALNGKWNFISPNGEYLSNVWFEDADRFSSGWASVKLNGKWNFINPNGKYLSNVWFEKAYNFSSGWAGVALNGKWNFINPNGEYLSKNWFDFIFSFRAGKAFVQLNGKWHQIDSNGEYCSREVGIDDLLNIF